MSAGHWWALTHVKRALRDRGPQVGLKLARNTPNRAGIGDFLLDPGARSGELFPSPPRGDRAYECSESRRNLNLRQSPPRGEELDGCRRQFTHAPDAGPANRVATLRPDGMRDLRRPTRWPMHFAKHGLRRGPERTFSNPTRAVTHLVPRTRPAGLETSGRAARGQVVRNLGARRRSRRSPARSPWRSPGSNFAEHTRRAVQVVPQIPPAGDHFSGRSARGRSVSPSARSDLPAARPAFPPRSRGSGIAEHTRRAFQVVA